MVRVGVIGYGYWGPNLVRNFMLAPGSAVTRVCDLREERLAPLQKLYPGLKTSTRAHEMITDPEIDAVVIATPVSSHFELALAALQAGKHVLVEKPLASTSDQARRLVDEAASRKLVLLVDHTFVYTDAVRKIREMIASGQLGEIYYYDAVRVNLGLFQHDVNVIWDLAIHDLSIIDYVLPEKPIAVSATGISHVPGEPENVAYITLFFNSSQIAHVHV
ncbi:MAG TPA: Gfo/Idh/MocA family oxidoreductase, partial [Pyrinomonadaceae bacterium]|nr:Gfo/Idh/MocA family oxidoreductase [Pyrinomonadaceae bacterium]